MITLKATWDELKTIGAWTEWLSLAKKEHPYLHEIWTDNEGCFGCKHFQELFTWCALTNAPATINPYLTPRTGYVGMACFGAAYTALESLQPRKD